MFRLPATGLHQAQITSEATTARDRRFYIITTIFSVQHINNYEQKTCNKGLTCPQSKRYLHRPPNYQDVMHQKCHHSFRE